MKLSEYNYFIPFQYDKYIVFNGITSRFFLFSNVNVKELKKVLEDPVLYNNIDQYSDFIKKMYSEGFLVDDEVDELQAIKNLYEKTTVSDRYELMILPTYDCNFSCWYCVQHHRKEYMSDDIIRKVKLHIKKYIVKHNIKSFNIMWFGGEPMLTIDTMKDITSFAKQFCKDNGVLFDCSITTNGSLLTSDNIMLLKELSFDDFQITLDGNIQEHNKVRFNANIPDSFDLILSNVATIVRQIPDVNLTLRYNYTRNNLDDSLIDEVNTRIPKDLRRKIHFMPRKVWQEDENNIPNSKLQNLIKKAKLSGYIVEIAADVQQVCYVDNKHFNTIFHNGTVDKCANMNIDLARGILGDNGEIIWKSKQIEIQNIFDADSSCKNCRFLPVCMGPCYMLRLPMIKNGGPIKCMYKDKNKEMINTIKSYCEGLLT